MTLTTLSHSYTGTQKEAIATATPGGLNVVLSYDGSQIAPTNAGSYNVFATVGTSMCQVAAEGILTIVPEHLSLYPKVHSQCLNY